MSTMQKGQKRMENSLLKATANSHLAPSSSSHALFNVNNNKQRATSVRGMFLGWFFFLQLAYLLLQLCCLQQHRSPGHEGVPQRLKNQGVWKHEEMFKTVLVVVTRQNMSVMLSRLSDNELWDVSLCFTIHIYIRTRLCLCNAGRCRRRPKLRLWLGSTRHSHRLGSHLLTWSHSRFGICEGEMGLTSLFPLDESTHKGRVPYLNRSRNLLGRNHFPNLSRQIIFWWYSKPQPSSLRK